MEVMVKVKVFMTRTLNPTITIFVLSFSRDYSRVGQVPVRSTRNLRDCRMSMSM